jgi:hypothetical protein
MFRSIENETSFIPRQNQREHAVVRPDKPTVIATNRDRRPIRSDAGIDDHNMDGARRERVYRIDQYEGRSTNVSRGNLMGNIYDGRVRRPSGEDTLHCGDVPIDRSEIGQ